MSIRLMSAIFESTELAPTERLIMLALADHADDDGRCYPGMTRLAQRTGLSERAVQTNIRKLVLSGYIRIAEGGGKGRTNLYFISANPAADAPRRKCTPAAAAPQTPQEMHPNPAAAAPEPSRTINEPSFIGQAKQTRRCRLPDGWVPSQRNIQDAIDREFTESEIQNEADKFSDYHRAKGTTFADWDAGWRTWLGNARKFGARGGMAFPSGSGGRGQGGSIASIVARRHAGG